MKVAELVEWLEAQDPEASVVPVAFYGTGAPTGRPYAFEQMNFRSFDGVVWLGFDVYDARLKRDDAAG